MLDARGRWKALQSRGVSAATLSPAFSKDSTKPLRSLSCRLSPSANAKLLDCLGRWYVEADVPLTDLRRIISAEFAPRGVNTAMVYGLNAVSGKYGHSEEDLIEFLDACAAVGFKIW